MTDDDPDRWYSTNSVGVPSWLLASPLFNARAPALTLHGTRETHPGLFRVLDEAGSQEEAAEIFDHYMTVQFGPIFEGQNGPSWRRTYLDLLRGWGVDSSSPHGAVLKGWVESRFGLVPTYHKETLGGFPSEAWAVYFEEKASRCYHASGINFQLDLLYEYAQWCLRRFAHPGPRRVTLWRGSNDCEQQLLEGTLRDPWCVLRLNNVISFTSSRERADEFGDWVLEVDIPTCKLLYFPGLIREPVFNSEREYLVLGGAYLVAARRSLY
ncbi:NAD(+)--dinitrogen-reductase ADP-D-ribosyltransferase [Pararhodospirillum photometricum]|uniref:NAD(+)--dinitrogen-reductase ADP-D-ribosyltransferase n=1 Tax=Pararhodospirillum photometricum TaxID=1084 RepID=UPI001F57BD6B|nr:NAD(+)--dinitrogen-reductase ADP-D-ribosyltransferase [Pararhodospirillum photometricum]